MVVAAQHIAAEAGVSVMRQGGNAVDAAVATAYALAVTYPEAGNLGGGGFMTFRLANGQTRFLDFREKAPGAATPKMYDHASSTDGWLAAGIPGSVAGLETARAIWGRLGRAADLAPAIRLARDGFVLGQGDLLAFDEMHDQIASSPDLRALFARPDGSPLQPGDRLKQPLLARTLQTIAHDGPDAFYRGPIGREIARAAHAGGGIITVADLAAYRTRVLPPVSCTYRGYLIESAPPPSSGGVVLCEILNVLNGIDMKPLGFHSAVAVHDMAEAMRHAFHDRNTLLGDPAFVQAPINDLLSAKHAAEIRAEILPDHATPSASLPQIPGPATEGHNTTHLSVVDAAGNAVSLTTTLNDWFGAKVVAGSTGILMNDEMDDFTTRPGSPNMFGLVQGPQNAIQPGKTPLSSMSPTIVSKDGHLVMVIGSPGGSRIPTITLEAILNVIDNAMDIAAAIDAPRIHEQWLPDVIEAEDRALSPDTRAILTKMGYEIRDRSHWGAAEGILVGGPSLATSSGKALFGANDVRAPAGAAAGY
jgi:gamma-glutamyltranspeptidase/glutathione hydrolase